MKWWAISARLYREAAWEFQSGGPLGCHGALWELVLPAPPARGVDAAAAAAAAEAAAAARLAPLLGVGASDNNNNNNGAEDVASSAFAAPAGAGTAVGPGR